MSKSREDERDDIFDNPDDRNTSDGVLCVENSVVLSPTLKSWIEYIGVDVNEYQRALYTVLKCRNNRYYRLLGNSDCSGHESVKWLRDVNLFVTRGSLNQSSIGIDASSAAVIDTLRLSKLVKRCNTNSMNTPPEVTTNVPLAVEASSNYLSLKSIATPRDRGGEKSSTGPQVEPAADLREAEGEVNRECRLQDKDWTSSGEADDRTTKDGDRTSDGEDDGIWILDMCCAPGGKLLAMIDSIVRNYIDYDIKWNIIGIDKVKRRLDICRSLLKYELVHGININLYCCDALEFDNENMFNKFDRILLDVECTHEGSLRSVIRTLKYWDIKSLEERWCINNNIIIIENQKLLLKHAIKLIKSYGIIIYSTCSLDPKQNELLILNILNEYNNIKLYPIPIHQCKCCTNNNYNHNESWPIDINYTFNIPNDYIFQSNNNFNCKNSKSPPIIKFNPLNNLTDGQFIACLIKIY